ncbi:hypothetical protein [Thalassomonas sp. M1454]|nr:hypothetical protein [Thalassomonas sp. M1454]
MKTDKKIAAGAGLTGALFIEEALLWSLDRMFDLFLVYKDTITVLISNF